MEQWLKEKHHISEWIGLGASIGCLLIFGAAALVIGLLVRKPFMGLNHFMEEKLKETEML